MGARDLSFRHLLALQSVHQHGSYRRAADALGYSQAAITQQIAALEKAIGAPVFNRHPGPRPATLSTVGCEVLAAAADLLARADLLDARVTEVRDGRSGRLSIGTFQSVSATLLPGVVTQTCDQEAGVDISVVESRDNADLIAGLVTGRLDVSFLVGPITDDRLTIREVCRDPFVVMRAAAAPRRRSIRLTDLEDVPLIGHDACVCHEMVEHCLREAGITPSYVFRSNDNAAVQAMVRAGLGTAVMPLLAINTQDPTIQITAIHPPLPERSILIAVPKNRPAPTAIRFVERSMAAGRLVLGTQIP
jgi:DNA-binding transcriptional LysR family regulator